MSSTVAIQSRITVRRSVVANRQLRGGQAPSAQLFVQQCCDYEQELFAVAMRMCRNPDDAHDLVQETLMRAMIAYQSFETGTNLRAWLYRVITNAFINGYRKRRRHHRLQQAKSVDVMVALYGQSAQQQEHPLAAACEGSIGDEVSSALAALAPEYRDVVESADLRGEKYRDIAQRLGVPVGTVMSRLFRARRALQKQLAQYASSDFGLCAA
jgi:RNA polymerase sigma-70 factor, ECF subfamily